MKKLSFIFLLLPIFASAQNGYNITIKHEIRTFRDDSSVIISDTIAIPFHKWREVLDTPFLMQNAKSDFGSYTLELPWNPPPPITVRIYVDDDDPVQTLIDALKKAGVIVERIEWNYEKKYSDYKIIKY